MRGPRCFWTGQPQTCQSRLGTQLLSNVTNGSLSGNKIRHRHILRASNSLTDRYIFLTLIMVLMNSW